MNLAEMFIGQAPEAVYFALFIIFTKQLKEKRLLYILLMIIEYILLKQFIHFSMWFQISYTAATFILLKVLYKERAQITDIFTFGIASILLIIISLIIFMIFGPNMMISSIINRVILFMIIIIFKNKLPKIQSLYKKLWNRNNKTKNKMKSTTFRGLNIVIFNIMFYIINLGMIYALIIRK